MEEILKNFKSRAPRAELRERIIEAAREQLSAQRSLSERMWASRTFWGVSAAAILLGLLLPMLVTEITSQEVEARKRSSEAISTAETLSAMMGDGAALRARFAAQLTGPVKISGKITDDLNDLMRRLKWQG